VRRAAIECAALRNSAQALAWLRQLIEDRSASVGARRLAIQALAALQLPHATLPVLEQLARSHGPDALRIDAIRMIAKFRNLRSVSALLTVSEDINRVVAGTASAALDELIEVQGGRSAVIDKMLDRAIALKQQGKVRAAGAVLEAASRLAPYDGRVLYQVATLSVA
jgi:HEAT repeat protein